MAAAEETGRNLNVFVDRLFCLIIPCSRLKFSFVLVMSPKENS